MSNNISLSCVLLHTNHMTMASGPDTYCHNAQLISHGQGRGDSDRAYSFSRIFSKITHFTNCFHASSSKYCWTDKVSAIQRRILGTSGTLAGFFAYLRTGNIHSKDMCSIMRIFRCNREPWDSASLIGRLMKKGGVFGFLTDAVMKGLCITNCNNIKERKKLQYPYVWDRQTIFYKHLGIISLPFHSCRHIFYTISDKVKLTYYVTIMMMYLHHFILRTSSSSFQDCTARTLIIMKNR